MPAVSGLPQHIAKHFRSVFFGGNWTSSNLKDQLADVSWQQATTQVYDLNTIATLTHHLSYYVTGVLSVLKGGELTIRDKFSFTHVPIKSADDWKEMQAKIWAEVEEFATLVEQLPEETLWDTFTDPKYGNYYSNLHGIIEHAHYHLGQVVLVKKVLAKWNG